jgi:hypothetical protein
MLVLIQLMKLPILTVCQGQLPEVVSDFLLVSEVLKGDDGFRSNISRQAGQPFCVRELVAKFD